jgi:hypothetical protein
VTLAASPELDLHEGITDPAAAGCGRWPERLRLRSSNGELVRGRCRSTNLCAYCAKLGAVENSELLALDALAGDAPQVWAVLTTRSTDPDPAAFYRSRDALVKALRRRWPELQWAALVEFTTGYGPRSGGHRRPHWNLLLKGVGADDLAAVREVIAKVWCPRVDALPQGQYVGAIEDAGGVMAYIALHFQKEAQAPPPGWRGHRFLHSRGYLATSTPQARDAARRSLRFKRELWRALRRGEDALDAEISAHRAIAIADATTWELCQPSLEVLRSLDTDFLQPTVERPAARGQLAAGGTRVARAVEPPGALPCPAPHRPPSPAARVRTPARSAARAAAADLPADRGQPRQPPSDTTAGRSRSPSVPHKGRLTPAAPSLSP